jgi:hypothetical protein
MSSLQLRMIGPPTSSQAPEFGSVPELHVVLALCGMLIATPRDPCRQMKLVCVPECLSSGRLDVGCDGTLYTREEISATRRRVLLPFHSYKSAGFAPHLRLLNCDRWRMVARMMIKVIVCGRLGQRLRCTVAGCRMPRVSCRTEIGRIC